jgi:hypothetical protein
MINQNEIKQGKIFENELTSIFRPLSLRKPITWDRIMDSGGAGNIVGAVKGDFDLTIKSKFVGMPYRFIIECKASSVVNTFAGDFRDRIRSNQIAKMRLAQRAGVIGIFWFKSVKTGDTEIWSAHEVYDPYNATGRGRKGLKEPCAYTIHEKNLGRFAELLVADPEKFIIQLGVPE